MHLHVHVFRGILGGTGAQAVQSQRKLIAFALVGVVFTAGVQLAEDQLPVIAVFFLVKVHRHAAAEVLNLKRSVLITGGDNFITVTLTGFVDGVGQDLEHCVLATLQPVRPENDRGTFPYPIGSFQRGNAFISVVWLFCRHLHFILTCNISLNIVFKTHPYPLTLYYIWTFCQVFSLFIFCRVW